MEAHSDLCNLDIGPSDVSRRGSPVIIYGCVWWLLIRGRAVHLLDRFACFAVRPGFCVVAFFLVCLFRPSLSLACYSTNPVSIYHFSPSLVPSLRMNGSGYGVFTLLTPPPLLIHYP